jgi:hypothetical protein
MVGQVGYPTVGGAAVNPFTQGVSCRFVPKINAYLSTGRVSKGVVWIDNPGDSASFAIYSDNAGNPDALLAYSSVIPLTGSGWYDFCELREFVASGLDIQDNNPIHLAVWVDNAGAHSIIGDNNSTNYIGGTNDQFSELEQGANTFPNWKANVSFLSRSDLNLSIYVEYYSTEIVLGYPSIGKQHTSYTAPAQVGSLFTAEKTKLFDSVYVRIAAASSPGRMSVALYTNNVTTPDTLVCQSGLSYATFSTVEKWYCCPMKGLIRAGNSYWIVVSCDHDFIMMYDSTSGGSPLQTFDDYPGSFNIFGSTYNTGPDTFYPRLMSFYLQNSTYFAEASQFTTFNGLGTFGKLLDNHGFTRNLNRPKLINIGAPGTDFVANSSTPYTLPGLTGSAVYAVSSDDTISRYGGTISLILPSPLNSDVIGIKNICSLSNDVLINGNGAHIDGKSTWTLTGQSPGKRYQEITLVTDRTDWFII